MKVKYEKIEPTFGSSFTIRQFKTPISCETFPWHCHPEYEIVYLKKGSGTRQVGNHISHFHDGELIFIGPNLPHFGFSERQEIDNSEIVIQLKADFLGEDFLERPEMYQIQQLFERSKFGITFNNPIKHEIGEEIQQLLEMNPFDRLIQLLKIFQALATTNAFTILNADGYSLEVDSSDYQRIQTIYEFTQSNFQQNIDLQTIASKINMTPPAFCRFFKRLTGKTFTNFVSEIRIANACQLLHTEENTIAKIAYDSGFNNLSHFNNQFKKTTGKSPSQYRKTRRKIIY